MKKIIVNLVLILAFVCGFSTVRAKAYSVELVKNGIYAKYIPENVMKNAPVLFKKNVDKVMKYYEKHKNESDYDFLQKLWSFQVFVHNQLLYLYPSEYQAQLLLYHH